MKRPPVFGIFKLGSKECFGFFWEHEVAEALCESEYGEEYYVDELLIEL